MVKCSYCSKTSSRERINHRFPLSTPLTLAKWLRHMAIKDWYPTEESRLCSDHFDPSSIRLEHGKIRLRDGSIPTIFSPESRMRGAASISQTPPVPEVTELEQVSLQQPTNIDDTELSMNPLLEEMNVDAKRASESSESLVTCPQCNHTFNSEGLTENSRRKSSSNENHPNIPSTNGQMHPCEISKSILEMVFSASQRESEPAAISSRGELQSPNADEKRLSTAHDHRYEISPPTARRKLQSLSESNKKLRKGLKLEKQKNNRMRKRITSLQEVVGARRRNRIVPENSIDFLDTIAETDVSGSMKLQMPH